MAYKMAVVDIDGTIVSGGNAVSPRVLAVVREAVSRGFPVCVCTGRHVVDARPVIEALGTGMPYCVVDGLGVFDGKTHAPIYENRLPNGVMRDCAARAARRGLYLEAVTADYYNKYVELAPNFDYGLGRVNPHAKYFDELNGFWAAADAALELICGGEEAALAALAEELAAVYGEAVLVRRLLWAGYIFISAPGGGKAGGAKRLAEAFGFTMADVVAIGDDLNDLDMLEAAGLGVAMGNATERAKAAADVVTDDVLRDGAAAAIEKYLFGQ